MKRFRHRGPHTWNPAADMPGVYECKCGAWGRRNESGEIMTARIRNEHKARAVTVRDSWAAMSNEEQLEPVCDGCGVHRDSMRLTDVDEMRRDHVDSLAVAKATRWQDLITPAEQASIEDRYGVEIDRRTGKVKR